MGPKNNNNKRPQKGKKDIDGDLLDKVLSDHKKTLKNVEKIEEKDRIATFQNIVVPQYDPTSLRWDQVPTVREQYNGSWPAGEITPWCDDRLQKSGQRELDERECRLEQDIADARQAAEVHRQVRKKVREAIKPGMSALEICNMVENGTRRLVEANGIQAGIAFPTGFSINNCAAHWTPFSNSTTVLKKSDVVKIDFGVHVAGRVIDSAFTVHFDHQFDTLVEAVKDATNTGIREAGIDVRLAEIGASIQEVMESYEVTIKGETRRVKPVSNLTGHSIERYKIHAGKSVPIVANSYDPNIKMKEGEFYAVETFGSTGRGYVIHAPDTSHFMRSSEKRAVGPLRLQKSRQLLKTIEENFSTLAFCQRYLDRIGCKGYESALNELQTANAIVGYPPLEDKRDCYTAQWEHTLVLRPTCKEVLSRGDDY